jgi:terephthalate 1,2-dioxygenase oxygenase component alpha subunit
VVVVKDDDGEIYAFENRCAHRGALIALEKSGKPAQLPVRLPRLELQPPGRPDRRGLREGRQGAGRHAGLFCKEDHGPRKLRMAVYCGLVFGSFSDDVPPIEEYLGDEICQRIERVLHKPVQVIGRFTQALPNNWKLYVENVKDSYHASLLHLFFTTFELNRLSQKGGVIVDESGGHHVSFSMIDPAAGRRLVQGAGPALRQHQYRLKDPRCWPASPSTTTASRCRSCRCSRASCCSRSRTAWPCARCCPRARTAPS